MHNIQQNDVSYIFKKELKLLDGNNPVIKQNILQAHC